MKRMPRTVEVGPHTYKIIRKAREESSQGLCEFNDVEIHIAPRLSRSKAREVLLHEIMHACTYPALCGKTTDDESFVDGVAPVLLQVLRANPEVVEYLTK